MKIINIASSFGRDISSRAAGRQLRLLLQSDGGCVDFLDVRMVSESFADEAFGILVASQGDEWFRSHVKLVNLSETHRDAILKAIARRLQAA